MKAKLFKPTMVLIIVIAMACLLAGCKFRKTIIPETPEGYTKIMPNAYNSPLYSGFNLDRQFPEINRYSKNSTSSRKPKHYFIYNDEVYYIRNNDSPPMGLGVSIHKAADGKYIGDLQACVRINRKIDKKEYFAADAIFFVERYLYVFIIRSHSVYAKKLGYDEENWESTFEKYEYFRFDMETAEIEEISYDLFIENYNKIIK
jgi:hypothetical protein